MSMDFDEDGWPEWKPEPVDELILVTVGEYNELRRGYRACRLKCGSLIRNMIDLKQKKWNEYHDEIYDDDGKYRKNVD